METQARAKIGGEVGANGEFYEGGKFIATTDKAKRLEARKNLKFMARKQQVKPYVWELPPAPNAYALWGCLGGIENYDRGSDTFSFNANLRCEFATAEAIKYREETIALWNTGARWRLRNESI